MSEYQSIIYICIHCGERCKGSGKYCEDCRTKEGRNKVDEWGKIYELKKTKI